MKFHKIFIVSLLLLFSSILSHAKIIQPEGVNANCRNAILPVIDNGYDVADISILPVTCYQYEVVDLDYLVIYFQLDVDYPVSCYQYDVVDLDYLVIYFQLDVDYPVSCYQYDVVMNADCEPGYNYDVATKKINNSFWIKPEIKYWYTIKNLTDKPENEIIQTNFYNIGYVVTAPSNKFDGAIYSIYNSIDGIINRPGLNVKHSNLKYFMRQFFS